MNKKSILFWILFLFSCCFIIIFLVGKQNKIGLPIYIDPFDGSILIEENLIPGGKIETKTETKTSTKTNIKKVKVKKEAKSSYTKKLPEKIKTKTKTFKKETNEQIIQTKIITKTITAAIEKYTKKSKIKKVITKVTTKITTITEVSKLDNIVVQSASAEKIEVVQKVSNLRSLTPKADEKLIAAYEDLGFTVSIDSTVNYTGCFDARARRIILKNESSLSIYHELGHFLAFLVNNIDKSQNFSSIYKEEKELYKSYNKNYVTQNASEYFAESVKDYYVNNKDLKINRPKTYDAIVSALNKITEEQIIKYKTIYSSIWV